MIPLLIATRNAHKVIEIRAILGDEFRYLTVADLPGAPDVAEDAPTFAGNATRKAVALADWLTTPGAMPAAARPTVPWVMADDSGLEVDALAGAPGVQSARFAALDSGGVGNSSTAANNAKLLRLMAGVPPERRTARFRCVIALVPVPAAGQAGGPGRWVELAEGACEGAIALAPRGSLGFGYDPLFVPTGFEQTFGELPEAVKNRLSHRARALAELKARLGQIPRAAA